MAAQITRKEAGYLFASYNNVSDDLVDKFLDLVFGINGQGIYLKIDGSNHMEGTLNMFANDIFNVQNINLDGTPGNNNIFVSGGVLTFNNPIAAGTSLISGDNVALKQKDAATNKLILGSALGDIGFFNGVGKPQQTVDGTGFVVTVDPAVLQLQTIVGDLRSALGNGANGYNLVALS